MALVTSGKSKSIVGLDIEAGSIAATEVRSNGSVEVIGHGILPLPAGVFREGEVADADALGDAIKELFAEHKLSRNVRLGIANQRVAVRSMKLPAIEDHDELETAIRFQAQDHIPMPLEQSVLDWQVTGHRRPRGASAASRWWRLPLAGTCSSRSCGPCARVACVRSASTTQPSG